MGVKLSVTFSLFLFCKELWRFKVIESILFVRQNVNFTKNENGKSKMENLTHSFSEMNLVLQLVWELRMKSKTVMSWSSRKKKGDDIFCNVYFVRRNFFKICVLSRCITYWINFQNIYTVTFKKSLLHTRLSLVFIFVESLQCILKFSLFFASKVLSLSQVNYC